MYFILSCFSPEQFHVCSRSAVVIRKIRQDHSVKLLSFKHLKTHVGKEIITFIIVFTDRTAAQSHDLFFPVIFNAILAHSLKRKFFYLLLLTVLLQTVHIPLADIHVTKLIEQALAFIWNRICIMSSILTFPYKPVCLCIQKYPCPFVRIRRLLRDRSILCDHMNKFHIRYLCCDLISMADIIQCFDLLCFHRIFCQKTLVYNAEHGINISALQLIPRKRFHLISVMRINLTGFILISDQV